MVEEKRKRTTRRTGDGKPNAGKPGKGRGKGGGPKSKRGKERMRLNPIRHGVYAETPVIPLVERQEDWDKLRSGLFEYWAPRGTMQEELVDRIGWILWRMRRNLRFERGAIESYMGDVPRDWREARQQMGMPVPDTLTAQAVAEMDRMLMARLLPGDEDLDKVMRNETKLHKFLLQTIHTLLVQQGLMGNVTHGKPRRPDLDPPGMPCTRKQPRLQAEQLGASRSKEWTGDSGQWPGGGSEEEEATKTEGVLRELGD